MGALSATLEAVVAGSSIRAAVLCEFAFASGTERIWPGHTALVAGGYTWRAMGVFVSVDGLRTRADMAAEPITFKISGVDPSLIAVAKNSAAEAKNRACNVYLQFFDEAWATLDDPVLLKSAIMDQVTYRASGPTTREITLTAEGIFAARNYAPYAYYTDRDQNQRVPGDRGLELIGSLINKTVTWPDF